MGAEHGHSLYFHGHSVVHTLPAQLKVAALLAFMLLVVATPAGLLWPYAVHLVLILLVIRVSRVPAAYLARRMVIEVPFAVFAVALPFVADGAQVTVLGLSVSQPGLLAATALLAKSTLGVLGGVLLAATTEARDLLIGLTRLRVPGLLVQIAGFMVRYVEVVAGEARRMAIARTARGFQARSPRQWPTLARSLGTLFVRSYERGERVHLAMLSRGYAGALPDLDAAAPTRRQTLTAAVLPLGAAVVWVTARVSAG